MLTWPKAPFPSRFMQSSTQTKFRIATLLLAALLGLQCVWLLLAELSRAGIDRLPTEASAAAAAAGKRNRAAWAADFGVIRGELWAQLAFTYADLMFDDNTETADTMQKVARARVGLEHALYDAPAQPGAWLLRAGLGLRYPSLGLDAVESLKMSYYTGPTELDLIPLRLRLTALSTMINDVEMQQFLRRDLRLLLARKQQSAIADAYNGAAPPGKRVIERTLDDIDHRAAESLRAGTPKQPLPD
jgi:hypothetical protein